MHEATFEEDLDRIVKNDSRYHRDVYLFIREALDHARRLVDRKAREQVRHVAGQHVTGQELLAGIREYALAQFGPMAITVFEEWGVRNCRDFGEIVFNMVEAGLLAKTDQDSRADFEEGYDFEEAFRKPFLPQDKLPKPSQPEPKPSQA